MAICQIKVAAKHLYRPRETDLEYNGALLVKVNSH